MSSWKILRHASPFTVADESGRYRLEFHPEKFQELGRFDVPQSSAAREDQPEWKIAYQEIVPAGELEEFNSDPAVLSGAPLLAQILTQSQENKISLVVSQPGGKYFRSYPVPVTGGRLPRFGCYRILPYRGQLFLSYFYHLDGNITEVSRFLLKNGRIVFCHLAREDLLDNVLFCGEVVDKTWGQTLVKTYFSEKGRFIRRVGQLSLRKTDKTLSQLRRAQEEAEVYELEGVEIIHEERISDRGSAIIHSVDSEGRIWLANSFQKTIQFMTPDFAETVFFPASDLKKEDLGGWKLDYLFVLEEESHIIVINSDLSETRYKCRMKLSKAM